MHLQNLIVEVLLAFVNAKTESEQKQIVEENANLLLTGEAERLLDNPLRRYANDDTMYHHILESRDLLARCRIEGIDSAFRKVQSSLSDVRFAELLDVFQKFVSAGVWKDRKVYLECHSDL